MPLQPPPAQPPHLSLEFLDRADLDAVPALGAQKLADALDLADAWGERRMLGSGSDLVDAWGKTGMDQIGLRDCELCSVPDASSGLHLYVQRQPAATPCCHPLSTGKAAAYTTGHPVSMYLAPVWSDDANLAVLGPATKISLGKSHVNLQAENHGNDTDRQDLLNVWCRSTSPVPPDLPDPHHTCSSGSLGSTPRTARRAWPP